MGNRHSDHYDENYSEEPCRNFGKGKSKRLDYLLGTGTLIDPKEDPERTSSVSEEHFILKFDSGILLEISPGEARMSSGSVIYNAKLDVVEAVVHRRCFAAPKFLGLGTRYSSYPSMISLRIQYRDSSETLSKSWGGASCSSTELEIPGGGGSTVSGEASYWIKPSDVKLSGAPQAINEEFLRDLGTFVISYGDATLQFS